MVPSSSSSTTLPSSRTMVPYIDLSTLQTECRNDQTDGIDVASTVDMCREFSSAYTENIT